MPAPGGASTSVLAGTVLCGGCGEPLVHREAGAAAGVYACPSGCRPPVPAAELDRRVGRAVLERMWTADTLARMAAAQELLDRLGYGLHHRVPVSLKHALYQWEHEFDDETRRALVQDAVIVIVLFPAARLPAAGPDSLDSADSDGELFLGWRRVRAATTAVRKE